jgi:hypothetical protein
MRMALKQREQEMRPEIDQRGEILHKLEWAATRKRSTAAHCFVPWPEERELLV